MSGEVEEPEFEELTDYKSTEKFGFRHPGQGSRVRCPECMGWMSLAPYEHKKRCWFCEKGKSNDSLKA